MTAPSGERLPRSTASPPSAENPCATSSTTPSAGSVSSEDQRLVVENGSTVRTPPGAAWKSSTASSEGCAPRMSQAPSHASSDGAWAACTSRCSSPAPSASVRQFIEFAVNIPEHDPQVGHAEQSTSVRPSSLTCAEADAEIAVTRSVGACATPSTTTALPASIGPPETNTVGTSSRSAALRHARRDG